MRTHIHRKFLTVFHVFQHTKADPEDKQQAAGGKGAKIGGKEAEGFLQYYMEQLTDAFGEDLDKMRREVRVGVCMCILF
jgi:hypothetical protein